MKKLHYLKEVSYIVHHQVIKLVMLFIDKRNRSMSNFAADDKISSTSISKV